MRNENAPTPPKTFVVGFNKCGTTSLHLFFQRSGLRSMHWDDGRLGPKIADNIAAGRGPVASYEEYDCFSNMDYACEHRIVEIGRQHFREIAAQEPNAKFILNVRDVDRWIASRLKLGVNQPRLELANPTAAQQARADCPVLTLGCRTRHSFAEKCRRYHGLNTIDQVVELWREQWDSHTKAVISEIPPEQLLVFNIENDDPVAICDFLGLPRKIAKCYSHANATLGPAARAAIRLTPRFIKTRIPRHIKEPVRTFISRV